MGLRVHEIFHSIQGESTRAGWPCVFVRLTGCNLRCTYCDTRYAYDRGEDMAVEDILERIAAWNCNLVEITGGEPLIQEETPVLAARLLERGKTVLLETNGSRNIGEVDERCVKIVDFKCPSSGESSANDYGNLARLSPRDEVKLVVADRSDYEFARDLYHRMRWRGVTSPVHFSPVFGILAPSRLAGWILSDGLQVRLNLQLHKFIWDPDARGV